MRTRSDLASLFLGEGVELGVAQGAFSKTILKRGKIARLWSVDRWSDHHDLAEYHAAASMLAASSRGRCIPLRMTFAEAATLFAPASLDFVYVDGYAHTGQESGETLAQWWSTIRPGGIFAGHDYHPDWPKTIAAVDAFVAQHGLRLHLTRESQAGQYPSWYVVNTDDGEHHKLVMSDSSPIAPHDTIVLVGNGPAVLRSQLGPVIDGFDQVIRFNTFCTAGFEPHVGTRTSLWSTFGRGTMPRDGTRPQRAIFIHGTAPKEFYIPVKEAFGIPRAFFDGVRSRVRAASLRRGDELERLLPSSGLVVCLWLLETWSARKIALTGFDHFSKVHTGQHHYWLQQSFTPPPEHDGEAEASIFGGLEASGRVRYL